MSRIKQQKPGVIAMLVRMRELRSKWGKNSRSAWAFKCAALDQLNRENRTTTESKEQS